MDSNFDWMSGPSGARTIAVTAAAIAVASITGALFLSRRSINQRGKLPTAASQSLDYFSDDYYDARRLFIQQARDAGAELVKLPLDIGDMDLSIDIAVIRGASSNNRLLIHISGTHGVEGFAGSAIQSRLLHDLANATVAAAAAESMPTVVFVHALNPYGFAKLRRWNEQNVDLNRNYLTAERFHENIMRDPNAFGYLDFYDMINPPQQLDWKDMFWLKALYYILRYGYAKLKSALVSGNYRFAKSMFYGGTELQQSHVLLAKYLRENFSLSQLTAAAVIDVHTGLGPKGFDTLGFDSDAPATAVAAVSAGGEFDKHITGCHGPTKTAADGGNSTSSSADSALSGYSTTEGFTGPGMAAALFPRSATICTLTQEFGTVSGIRVFQALRAENAAFHHHSNNNSNNNKNNNSSSNNRLPLAEQLRDVFYLRSDDVWRQRVLDAGCRVFYQLRGWLQKQ